MTAQRLHSIGQLPAVFVPGGGISPAQQPVAGGTVRHPAQQRQQSVGQVGDEPELVRRTAVDHVLPDHQPQTVAVVIPALGFDLGMLAQQIEAQLFDPLQLLLYRCIGRGRVQTFRPVSLVQQTVQQQGLTIQAEAQHPLAVRRTAPFAQRKVAVDLVAARNSYAQVIEERMVRTPGEEVLLRDIQHQFPLLVGLVAAPVLGNADAAGPHSSPEVYRAAGLAGVYPHPDLALVKVRLHSQGADVVVRDPLQPDGLPDAALCRVEHSAWVQGLLASGAGAAVGGVLHGDPKLVIPGGTEQVGDIQCKRPVAALVFPGLLTVHPYRAAVVHCTKVQKHPSALTGWGRKTAAVVQPLAGFQGAVDPGGTALRRVGNEDLSVPLRRQLCCRSNCVLPAAVQIFKAVPPQGWTGVFG